MTQMCGWLSTDPRKPGTPVVKAMLRSLRVHPGQAEAVWEVGKLTIGMLELPTPEPLETAYAPAVTADGRYVLWMAGEAFEGAEFVKGCDALQSRTRAFRQRLLESLLTKGAGEVRHLDGEYQIALWDTREQQLTLLNDRFGMVPLYWANSSDGFAFAGGVRGVLMAPGISAEPDPEALREAVTFGGFRFRDRTNVSAVKTLMTGSSLTVRNGTPKLHRYWKWRDITPRPARPMAELVEEMQCLWKRAIQRRLSGAQRPGQTLSGGLDSRAIMAESLPKTGRWTAITYGVPGCDDARFAQQSAEAIGATWIFHPLYSGRDPDWLEVRTRFILQSDGLANLVDLMHYETLPIQASLLDVNLSGYLGGNAIAGKHFGYVVDAPSLMQAMSYYGTELGFDYQQAVSFTEKLIEELDGAGAHHGIFEHKIPQAILHCITHWRPWFRVRCPFIDYALFEFCQGLPSEVRSIGNLHEHWLLANYPRLFAKIPNQKTGMAILTPNWLLQAERARRFTWRKIQPLAARLRLPARPRLRNYIDDNYYWRTPEARRRMEAVILRPDSLSCQVLGRDKVTSVLGRWFEQAAAPAQVIGALYVYESYHQALPEHLKAAQRS